MPDFQNRNFNPVRIAQSRIGKVMATIPDAPEKVANIECSVSSFRPGFRTAAIFLVLLIGGGVVNFCYQAKLLGGPRAFDIRQVALRPGLVIRCKSCDKALYNSYSVNDAFATVLQPENCCPTCRKQNDLKIAVRCPQCDTIYDAETYVYPQKAKAPESLPDLDCILRATCPHCNHVYNREERVLLSGG